MGEQAKKSFIINVIFIGLWAVIIALMGKFLFGALLPFVIAVAVAALMQRPADKISQAVKVKKGICAVLLSAALYIALAGLLIFGIFKLFSFTGSALSSLTQLGNTLLQIFEKIEVLIGRVLSDISPDFKSASNKMLSAMLEDVTAKLSAFLSDTAGSIVALTPAFLFNSVVALAATCYIAKDFDGLSAFLKSFITEKTANTLIKIKSIFKSSVLKILTGYLILMVITFLELSVGLLILRVENWVIIALVIAAADALPILGVGAFLLPWGIVNIVLGDSFLGAGLMVLYLVIVIVRNFAEPKIVGDKTGINPLFILFAMFLGLKLFGLAGLIILPVTFIVVIKYYKNEMEIESSH